MDNWQELKGFIEFNFAGQITQRLRQTAEPAIFATWPATMHPQLAQALAAQGASAPYRHQAEAFAAISAGEHTVVVSPTASGKTLAFLAPILNDYLSGESFTTLFLYPTKALSRDQEGTLARLLRQLVAERRLGTFDGDTPAEERQLIRQQADFIMSNPDMLHSGILPNHSRAWKSFLARLRYIVIDEVHVYRGAYGSHVANVLRRLLRACQLHGRSPLFIASSATIANPGEHAAALCHRAFRVIRSDGAPQGPRELFLLNPPLVEGDGGTYYRKGPGAVIVPLLRRACELGIRTICFARARQEVERLHRAVVDGRPRLAAKIKPYRGGLLPTERRQLEKDLVSGAITGVITTSALELGIDIGSLQLCVLAGHPGTMASLWQRAGRVGRAGQESAVVFVAKNTSLDQFLVNHPSYLSGAPIEHAWLSANNPYILLQHLPCAAHEHPLRASEPLFPAEVYDDALELLRENGIVGPYRDAYRYLLDDYPSRGVNLRGMTDYNIQIVCGSEVIGELDPIGARGTLYKDAIYQHLGRRYMSLDLNLAMKLCHVSEVDVDYYTEAVWEGRVQLSALSTEKRLHGNHLSFGEVNVHCQPKLYKKIRERSYENIGYGPITLEAFIYDTTGFSLTAAEPFVRALDEADKRLVGAAFYGLSYILRQLAPGFCMSDRRDIDTDVYLAADDGERWDSALYLFDALEGGVGYAEKIYERLPEILAACQAMIDECTCVAGCPACVPPLPPGVADEELERFLVESNAVVAATRSFLSFLQSGTIIRPQLSHHAVGRKAFSPETTPDPARIKRVGQLQRAARIMTKKREREH